MEKMNKIPQVYLNRAVSKGSRPLDAENSKESLLARSRPVVVGSRNGLDTFNGARGASSKIHL
jgi:hypothetical protein